MNDENEPTALSQDEDFHKLPSDSHEMGEVNPYIVEMNHYEEIKLNSKLTKPLKPEIGSDIGSLRGTTKEDLRRRPRIRTRYVVILIFVMMVASASLALNVLVIYGFIPLKNNYGSRGLQGSQGPQGIQGLQGLQGIQGPLGKRGFRGPKGAKGQQGPPGKEGPPGPSGNIGPQGIQGTQGNPGPRGPSGGANFSKCSYKMETSTAVTANSLAQTTAILTEPLVSIL